MYRFEFDPVHRILRACIEGVLTDDSISGFKAEIGQLIAESHPNGCVVDLSETKQYDLSVSAIHDASRAAPALPNVSIPVIIVAPDAYMYGSSRMFQMLSEESRPWLRVVRSAVEAYQLLKLESPRFEPLPAESEERKKMWRPREVD